jgi:predicted ABC-type ATPase
MLATAPDQGVKVRMWFLALSSPELHLARIASRVAKGGHDIPEAKVRERFASSRANLTKLLPKLKELLIFDNSLEGDPDLRRLPSLRPGSSNRDQNRL